MSHSDTLYLITTLKIYCRKVLHTHIYLSARTKLMFEISLGKYLIEAYYKSCDIMLERERERNLARYRSLHT